MQSGKDFTSPVSRGFFQVFAAAAVFAAVLLLSNEGECQAPAPADASLIGTIISKTFTGAVIKDAKGDQSFYRMNDTLPDGSRIVKIADDHISLKGPDGSLFTMFILHEKTESHTTAQISAPAPPPATSTPSQDAAAPRRSPQRTIGRHASPERNY